MTDSTVSNLFAIWHGIDRRTIEWHPIIDQKKCAGCGLCVVTCGEKRNVFGYDLDKKKAVVMYPENCMVGCNNCTVGCLWNAISFQETEYARKTARTVPEDKIKNELENKFRSNPNLLVK